MPIARVPGQSTLLPGARGCQATAVRDPRREWSRRSGSNRRPAVYKTAALPTELPRRGVEATSVRRPHRACRRRATAWSATAAAADTLRLSSRPWSGIDATMSHRSRVSRASPRPSAPSTTTTGPSATVIASTSVSPSPSSPTVQTSAPAGVVEEARNPGHERDGEVLHRAGRGLERGRSEPRRALAGQHHAVDTGSLGRPEDRAEVPGVRDTVERDDEGVGRGGAGRRPQPRGSARRAPGDPEGPPIAREPPAAARSTGRTGTPRPRASVAISSAPDASLDDPHLVHRAPTGPQQLTHGVEPLDRLARVARAFTRRHGPRDPGPCRADRASALPAPGHRCQVVPDALSSMITPRAARSSRIRSAVAKSSRGAGVVARRDQRVDLVGFGSRLVSAGGEPQHVEQLCHRGHELPGGLGVRRHRTRRSPGVRRRTSRPRQPGSRSRPPSRCGRRPRRRRRDHRA